MTAATESLVTAAARFAARRELTLVRQAQASGQRGDFARAFATLRPWLRVAMSWSERKADQYCFMRLQQLAAFGIPAEDLEFIGQAGALMAQLTNEGIEL